jgi:tetratricopeptide (TPR) repeat protein
MFAFMNRSWRHPIFLLSLVCTACTHTNPSVENPLFNQPPLKEISSQINENPDRADLYFDRGRMLDRMEEDSLALIDYKKAVSIDSSRAEYFSAIGDILFEHQDIKGSIMWIERALKLNPKDPGAHLKMAKLFMYIKEYNSAFGEINTVLRQDVYNAEGYFLKGMIYKDTKDTVNARSSFQTAVQVAPDYRDAIIQLGLLHSGQKDPLALKYFDNAYRLDTSDLFPLFAKGVYYQNKGDYQLAKDQYKEVILRDNQYTDAHYNTAYILMQQDSVEKARRQYDLLTRLDPADPEAYYNRGLCSELMGNKQEALADYRQAITFDKNYVEAQQGIKRLEGK